MTRLGWQALLEHCRMLEQTVPGAAWKACARELIAAPGESHAAEAFQRWLALGPAPGQPSEAQCPIEDSAYQKGAVWCLALSHQPAAASIVGDFAIACLSKIPTLGAVSQKVGFACAQALGSMECSEAVSQLTRLRARVTHSVARRLIEKSTLHRSFPARVPLAQAHLGIQQRTGRGGSGLHSNGELRDPHGEVVDPAPATRVRLWHPLSSEPSDCR
jgi:hypothetical protein